MGQRTTAEGKVTAILVHKRMRASENADITAKVLKFRNPLACKYLNYTFYIFAVNGILSAASASCPCGLVWIGELGLESFAFS